MKIRTRLVLTAAALLCGGVSASAQQVPPFFGGGVVAYDPEVAVIQSGALMDVRATVSADRKYVTLDMRNTNSNVRSLQPFPVVTGPQGFVGGVQFPPTAQPATPPNAVLAQPAPATPARGGARGVPSRSGNAQPQSQTTAAVFTPSPDAINRASKSWILARSGMYLVKPLD
jgi:hypothetical protein